MSQINRQGHILRCQPAFQVLPQNIFFARESLFPVKKICHVYDLTSCNFLRLKIDVETSLLQESDRYNSSIPLKFSNRCLSPNFPRSIRGLCWPVPVLQWGRDWPSGQQEEPCFIHLCLMSGLWPNLPTDWHRPSSCQECSVCMMVSWKLTWSARAFPCT